MLISRGVRCALWRDLHATSLQTTHALDDLANIIAENDGRFPGYDSLAQGPAGPPVGITRESPFTTRFFTVRFDADGAVTTVDARALAQLLAILLDNACKYCDDGGAIHLQLSGGKHPLLELSNSYAAVGTLATDRLFDRFYRADPARTQGSGFGLGLSIAKAICERHHAQISAQAADDRTILFRVRF